MNILLLGQETNFRPPLVEALKQAGHEWQFPATRENAVALIQQHTFDCVVLAYSLASEMIEEFVELLNQVCPACPIIAMSEQDDMDWKLQPTMIIRADQDSEALIATLQLRNNVLACHRTNGTRRAHPNPTSFFAAPCERWKLWRCACNRDDFDPSPAFSLSSVTI